MEFHIKNKLVFVKQNSNLFFHLNNYIKINLFTIMPCCSQCVSNALFAVLLIFQFSPDTSNDLETCLVKVCI